MFPRKVPNTVFTTKPNLNNSLFIHNSSTTSNSYFFRCKFTLREITLSDVFTNIENAKQRMKAFLRNGIILQALGDTFMTVPRTLKNQSAGVLRVWAHQCECVAAQRLRRGQQMFCLYTKLWEERALKELLNRMRQQITRRSKELMFSAIGVMSYNWDSNRISNDEIMNHMNELDYLHILTEETMTCRVCKKIQRDSSPYLPYCVCQKKSAEKKTFDSWVPFIEKIDMLVWRKLHDSGHYEYKVYGSFNDVTAEDFLNVQIDNEYRKKWDTTAITLEVIDKDPTPQSNSDVVYWEMLWPKLFVNRDYVFNRRFMIDCKNKTIVIMSRGTEHPACPVRPNKYRVDHYWSYMVIKPYTDLDKPGIEFGLTYFDNPGVNIPSAVTAWVAIRAMPDYLMRLREATRKYQGYCSKDGNNRFYNFNEETSNEREEEDEGEQQQFEAEIEEIVTNNTIFEPEYPLGKITKKPSKSRSSQATNNPLGSVSKRDSTSKMPSSTPGTDILTAPSPMIQADSDRQTYWKYLHPNYYFS